MPRPALFLLRLWCRALTNDRLSPVNLGSGLPNTQQNDDRVIFVSIYRPYLTKERLRKRELRLSSPVALWGDGAGRLWGTSGLLFSLASSSYHRIALRPKTHC